MSYELKRILYVEDEADIRAVAKIALEVVGKLTVRMCSSGQEALDSLQEFQPDLALLDVMMPKMDGLSTAKKIREQPAYKTLPVIFLTAKVMSMDRGEYEEFNPLGVIVKPFDPMTLAAQIKTMWSINCHG